MFVPSQKNKHWLGPALLKGFKKHGGNGNTCLNCCIEQHCQKRMFL